MLNTFVMTTVSSSSTPVVVTEQQVMGPSSRIPVFDGQEYSYWADLVESYFIQVKLFDVVDGSLGESDADWGRKNQQALHFLKLMISKDLHMAHIHMKKASDLWKSFKNTYSKANAQHEIITAGNIWDYKYTGGSMAAYCNGLRLLLSENACSGGTFPPYHQAMILMRGLPDEYKGASDSLKKLDKGDWNLAVAIELVLDEEATNQAFKPSKQRLLVLNFKEEKGLALRIFSSMTSVSTAIHWVICIGIVQNISRLVLQARSAKAGGTRELLHLRNRLLKLRLFLWIPPSRKLTNLRCHPKRPLFQPRRTPNSLLLPS